MAQEIGGRGWNFGYWFARRRHRWLAPSTNACACVPARPRSVLRVIALCSLAFAMFSGGTSWACVPQPQVFVRPYASGPSGAQVTVEGLNFSAGDAEVRWNGLDGDLLASAAGGQFSLPVTIPQAEPGLYVVTALTRDNEGVVNTSAVASFQVTGPTGAVALPPSSTNTRSDPPDRPASSTTPGALAVVGALGMLGGALSGALVVVRNRRPSDEENPRTKRP